MSKVYKCAKCSTPCNALEHERLVTESYDLEMGDCDEVLEDKSSEYFCPFCGYKLTEEEMVENNLV